MSRRRSLPLVLALAAAVVLAVAAPAHAVTPFGPFVTVAPTPGPCTIDIAFADAEIAPVDGVVRGFVNFTGTSCDNDAIWYFGGRGSSWVFEETPYRGRVLGSDQYSASYVLFSNGTGIHLGKRGFATGDYLTPARQLSSTAPGAVQPQGDVLAGPSHTWWAVWSEQVGPTEFAQTELFQAKTYGAPDLARTRVTNNPGNDYQPDLAFKPGGGGELVFVRDDALGGGPSFSHIRLATASGNAGTWVGRQFATIGLNTGPSIDTTPGPGGHTYIAWTRNGQPFESDDRFGSFEHRAFDTDAEFATAIDTSGGQVHVVWEDASGTVMAERSRSGSWTKATVTGSESRVIPIVASVSGRATVVMASAERLYARTQVS